MKAFDHLQKRLNKITHKQFKFMQDPNLYISYNKSMLFNEKRYI